MQRGDSRLSETIHCKSAFELTALLVVALVLHACSWSLERVVTFSGRIVIVADSAPSDSATVNLADIPGYILYDKQIDGRFDDTAVFFGSEAGDFSGVLQYNIPAHIVASRLRKRVHLLLPELNVDTFLTVDIYTTDSDVPDGINEWAPIVVRTLK